MMNEPAPRFPDELYGPLVTWSADDMRIAVVFSKQQAAEAEAKLAQGLFLCVNIPVPSHAVLGGGSAVARFVLLDSVSPEG